MNHCFTKQRQQHATKNSVFQKKKFRRFRKIREFGIRGSGFTNDDLDSWPVEVGFASHDPTRTPIPIGIRMTIPSRQPVTSGSGIRIQFSKIIPDRVVAHCERQKTLWPVIKPW